VGTAVLSRKLPLHDYSSRLSLWRAVGDGCIIILIASVRAEGSSINRHKLLASLTCTREYLYILLKGVEHGLELRTLLLKVGLVVKDRLFQLPQHATAITTGLFPTEQKFLHPRLDLPCRFALRK
jgi:hypothetical protein